MKLLLDENLSDRIIAQIIDLYPDSEHVKTVGLMTESILHTQARALQAQQSNDNEVYNLLQN